MVEIVFMELVAETPEGLRALKERVSAFLPLKVES
jgi:hypothetical protein